MNAAQIHERGGGGREHGGAGRQQHGPAAKARLPPNPHRNESDPEHARGVVRPGGPIGAVRRGRLEDPEQHKYPDQERRVDQAADGSKARQCSPLPRGKSDEQGAKCDPAAPGQEEQRREKYREQDNRRQHAGFQHGRPRFPACMAGKLTRSSGARRFRASISRAARWCARSGAPARDTRRSPRRAAWRRSPATA